ncbi:Biopolymer transport protein ExbD/TolR [Marinobacterium lacunae]|uniref:Biopolymer transport protein ExbD/TolR n=1 Tax=Marinobacterium lacunae TaxID=1232683 RepID=A0A081FYV2_9GAMM|nr:biopolymer transporter ExbD [Marinobacterium lacunae]KEA63707.1 Biopolymer transport protein ExbD/TolR [Marinobacterium lacunae]
MIVDTGKIGRRDSTDDNVIPLINIVFLMLIFFMVAGQVSKSDVVKTDPPESVNDAKLQDQDSIDLIMTSTGALYIDDMTIEVAGLKSAIEHKLAEYSDLDNLQVRVKVDADLPVTELRALLRQVRDAGLVRVSLITRLSESDS